VNSAAFVTAGIFPEYAKISISAHGEPLIPFRQFPLEIRIPTRVFRDAIQVFQRSIQNHSAIASINALRARNRFSERWTFSAANLAS
jgi:hypothetical protein